MRFLIYDFNVKEIYSNHFYELKVFVFNALTLLLFQVQYVEKKFKYFLIIFIFILFQYDFYEIKMFRYKFFDELNCLIILKHHDIIANCTFD